ncbi:FAD-dependent oxidoreductase [Mycolicibacterium fortuitum]|uniref:Pyridine nucleotide-disulfide oxidoreductase dimerization region n=1 Tax=Mycolicibacterium fortuitum subsp. fortuitum DSM 46621 = ATCC 6841 = JCM 6387 TaxID=1214102 RepID=K0URP5_MYCFO|nr:FAD-dependent oxidoreductase [Mycolicibacterium fortuitum]AIY46705.1 Putative Dihydrolipoamide dehydrogenase [Mycobacterium sp. VKM Ac-1817D]CRL79527.1 mercuric reductase [Mycolicibacter nonchromogenicus]EJZ09797.1 pyridine nucleotide-disulfide oxidoreductase dimerization region [Mycolicibacterium fortuitum subsp. fortuitum DSM 46621 = ATCC 6841 = JCM 6387]WEV30150.1 FAD-dependent oxidoreductase [Mycolicibacterium fortuitum]CRL57591.1 mercuric reductase [Mycolicibacterium fortuitum subsp. f
MSTELDVDLAVIGFGKGGKTLAAALAKQGRRVVLIEQSAAMYGGTCINIGCVPTKSMVYRAELLTGADPHRSEYTEAVAATAGITAELRAINYAMLNNLDAATVLTGHARFLDPHRLTVQLPDGSAVTVTARWIVIGTGSRPVLPDIPGLANSPRVYTSTDLLARQQLPERLVVLGGGYVGLEFAGMYAAYGSAVTVLERGGQLLAREDPDVAAFAAEILAAGGVSVVTGAEVTSVTDDAVEYQHADGTHRVTAGAVLVALGREPVIDGLNLAAAGLVPTERGAVAVDEHLRTSQPHIFAVGDVNGGPQFTYISLDDYRVVLSQLTGDGSLSTTTRSAVPYALFTTPPLARVGLSATAAAAAGHRIKVASLQVKDMATMPRARIVSQTAGMMKMVVDADTDLILGAALLCHDAHEIINTVALAIRHGITATELRDSIYTHPSMTEGFNQLLGSL